MTSVSPQTTMEALPSSDLDSDERFVLNSMGGFLVWEP